MESDPKPFLTFTPATVQFGSVPQGTEHGKAVVTNVSMSAVDIKAVTKGCDCTEALIEQGTLRPGERREITFQWDTRGRRGDDGIIIGVVYTTEGDSTERIASLTLKATVIPDYAIVPEKLKFFSNRHEGILCSLIPTGNIPIKILGASVTHPAFSTTVDAEGRNVSIAFDPTLWSEEIRYLDIEISTTSGNEPVYRLPISILVPDR